MQFAIASPRRETNRLFISKKADIAVIYELASPTRSVS